MMKWDEITSNEKIFEFVESLLLKLQGNLRSEFCERFLKKVFFSVGIHCKERLLMIVSKITKMGKIQQLIKEKNYIDAILAEFETSNSFNEASLNASIVMNFADTLSEEQINRIVNAAISNDQITYSWGAQNVLKNLSLYTRVRFLRKISKTFFPMGSLKNS